MDNNLLFIIIGSSILFVGVVIWKVLWLLKKMNEEEQ